MNPPAVSGATLSKRALNRALLARQHLIERSPMKPLAMIEHLVGMQSQIPRPPYVGLWTRLETFTRDELTRLAMQKKVLRATTMRGTIHLMSTRDYVEFRQVLAPMLARSARGIAPGKKFGGMDPAMLHDVAREFFGKTPAPFDALRKHAEQRFPKLDPGVIRVASYSARMHVPLAIVPDGSTWGWAASSNFALAEKWLGVPIPLTATDTQKLILRYLAAFGPASPADAQAWSGLSGLKATFEKLRPKLVVFRDEQGRELFDLPKAPRPDEDMDVPVRFLAEYDNAVLSHDDRTRIIAKEHRPLVIIKNLYVIGTFLVDGFVAGAWRVAKTKKSATLEVDPFAGISRTAKRALESEGEALLEFLEPETPARSIAYRS